MKALFGRKFYNLKELQEATVEHWSDYTVIREVELTDSEFKKFTSNFLEDQPWIKKSDGGTNEKVSFDVLGSLTKILVKDTHQPTTNSPCYTAIED